MYDFIRKKMRFLLPTFVRHGFRQYVPRPVTDLPAEVSCQERVPKISVVVPSYNQGEFLERTITSVLAQGYPNLELIIVDGGSTDGSCQIIERYNEQLHWYCCEQDRGQTHAINKGFNHATGEILAWLNADDCHVPATLNRVANYLTSYPSVDGLYGNRIHIDEYDQEIGRTLLPGHDNKVLSWADFIPQETLFWRRSLWEKVGGKLDESFSFAMDWELLLRFRENKGVLHHIPCHYGLFRVHPQQKTVAQMDDIGFKEMQELRQRCLGYKPTARQRAQGVAGFLVKTRLYEIFTK